MSEFGVTKEGFKLKRFDDIASETTLAYQAAFGSGINLAPESALGQIKAIHDERESLLWELAQAVYNSQYPNTAFDVSLDHVSSITGVTRLAATRSKVTARIFGDLGATVPVGFTVSVLGNETAVFETQTNGIVHAGIDEVQTISFSAAPSSGAFTLRFNGNDTNSIPFSATDTDIQNELNALSGLSDVIVTGSFASEFTVTFTGTNGQSEQTLLEIINNTLSDGSPVTSIVTELIKGFLPHVDIDMTAQNTGPVQANAGSLTVIDTPVSGIDSATNLLDAELGRDTESDADFKLRRLDLLQRRGTAAIEGIRNEILAVPDVVQAIVVENSTLTTDGEGRPPKSFQAFVLGGDEQLLAESIFKSKPTGIETVGSISRQVVDSQGLTQTIKFSRANSKDIYITVTVLGNTDASEGPLYPQNGDQLIEAALLDFVQDFSIGQDVIVTQLFTPVNTVPGVLDIDIFVGLSTSPTQSDNLPMAISDIARFDSSRISVNS